MKKRMGLGMDFIKRAPSRECLDMFGGSVSIKEFRDSSTPIYVQLQNDHYQIPVVSIGNKPHNNPNIKSKDVQLKREKPLERSKSKLESYLKKKI